MKMRFVNLLRVGVAIAISCAASVQAGDEAAGPSPNVFVPTAAISSTEAVAQSEALGPEALALSRANTNRVVRILKSGQAFCASLDQDVYAIDCLAERMEAAAAAMPAAGEYAEARDALLAGAARLNALAVANADPATPRAIASEPTDGGIRTTRPLVPVRAEQLAEVAAQAQQIVEETETLLLRSAESSSARKVHYERIAAAVGSNKVLLRSL